MIPHKLRRSIYIVAAVAAVIYAAICAYMWATQRDRVFEPMRAIQSTPERLGIKYEAIHIPSGSGKERGDLDAWWIPADVADRPTIFYLHGNDRNISHGHNVIAAGRLHSLGYNLLMVDYRGFGKSGGGKPSEAKVYEDAEAGWQYLIKTRGVRPQQAFIYGHSLGGAIGIDLAVRHPEAAGLITESTFTSLRAMGELEYPYLPVNLLLNQRFESLQKISSLKIPVLLIHGTWDDKVPVRMSKQLYDAAPQPKSLILIEGGEHNNSAGVGWLKYSNAVTAFTKQYAH